MNRALFAISLSLAFSGALGLNSSPARAELVREQVQSDAITPEAAPAAADTVASNSSNNGDEEVIYVRKRKPAPKRRIVYVDAEEQSAEAASPLPDPIQAPVRQQVAIQPGATVATTTTVTQETPAAKAAGIGTSIDNSISSKMDGVKQQFEDKVVKMLDRIKITVDEDQPATQAAPLSQTVIKDDVKATSAAPAVAAPAPTDKTYMSVDQGAQLSPAASEGSSTAAKDDLSDENLKGKISIFPLAGITSIKSSNYTVDARYTAGFGIEAEATNNISIVGSYSYSQFNVGLGTSNPYYGYYQGTTLVNSNNLNALQYNQNLVDVNARFYLMPRSSRFRLYIGAGVGYSKSYLNYNQNSLNTYSGNPYATGQSNDYSVSQVLGQLGAGAEIQISKTIALGADFKYDTVLSSSQNDPLNNNAFVNNGYGYTASNNQSIVGGSLASEAFYSLTANVKVTF